MQYDTRRQVPQEDSQRSAEVDSSVPAMMQIVVSNRLVDRKCLESMIGMLATASSRVAVSGPIVAFE